MAMLFTGTAACQIPLSTIEDLQKIGKEDHFPLQGHYVLTQDIDASVVSSWNNGLGFEPIGDWQAPFTGVFDGQGYVIRGLVINRPEEASTGLFGEIGEGSEIRNVVVEGSFSSRGGVGALIGAQSGGTVINCHATATVSGIVWVGGLVGVSHDGALLYCSAGGEVSGGKSSKMIGGLVGYSMAREIVRCFSTAVVSGDEDTGGLVGYNHGTLVAECFASGAVYGRHIYAGGLIGNNLGIVTNCYTTGNVRGKHGIGGLVGFDMLVMNACYATGAVVAKGAAGGLTGELQEQAISTWSWNTPSFWDSDTTGQQASPKGKGLPSDRMMSRSTFEDAGWDFDTVWGIDQNGSYPYLLWQTGDAPPFSAGDDDELAEEKEETDGEGRLRVELGPVEEPPSGILANPIPENQVEPAISGRPQGPISEPEDGATLQEQTPGDTDTGEYTGCCQGCREDSGFMEVLHYLIGDWLLLTVALITLYGINKFNKRY